MADILEMGDEAYEVWLRENLGTLRRDATVPSEENLIDILSNALRTDNAQIKARQLIDLANMALAMADKTLGCQSVVATSIVLTKH